MFCLCLPLLLYLVTLEVNVFHFPNTILLSDLSFHLFKVKILSRILCLLFPLLFPLWDDLRHCYCCSYHFHADTHRCIYLALTFRKLRDPDSNSCCLLCFATWLSFWWLKLDIHKLWITTVSSPNVSFLRLPLQKAINLLISCTNAGWLLWTLIRVRNRVNWCLLQVQSLT